MRLSGASGKWKTCRAGLLLVLLSYGLCAEAQEQFSSQQPDWEKLPSQQPSSQRMLQMQRQQPQRPVSEFLPELSPADPVPSSPQLSVPPAWQQEPQPTPQTQTVSRHSSAETTIAPQQTVEPLKSPAGQSEDPQRRPLTRPEGVNANSQSPSEKRSASTGNQVGMTVVVLAGVITLIVVLAKLLKKHSPLAGKQLPTEVLELLGRKMLDQRHTIHFMRTGNRILIIGVSLDGMRTLAEITDPVEIDRISGQCKMESTGPLMSNSFKFLLSRNERTENSVQLDQQHRQRQQTRKPFTPPRAASFDWQTPDETQDSGISPDDIADLTRTLEQARERRA